MHDTIVYTPMVGDLLHIGHLRFLKRAKKFGTKLIVGLHPDETVTRYKRRPVVPYEQRREIIESIGIVDRVVKDCLSYESPTMRENIQKLKVDFLVHGGAPTPTVYEQIKKDGLCRVEYIPYNPGISTTQIINEIRKIRTLEFPKKDHMAVVSAGDAITAKLVEEAGFDGIWISGFEVSARLGLADNGTLTMTEMLRVANSVVRAVNIPVYVDIDTGYGGVCAAVRAMKEFEYLGCAGVCIEDNLTEKSNSLWGGPRPLLSKEAFGSKIKAMIANRSNPDFKIIARTEALIRGMPLDVAMERATHYAKCCADMVLVHSRDTTGQQAYGIAQEWSGIAPLVIVPTKFPQLGYNKLWELGYHMVILANQTERIKIKALRESLRQIKTLQSVDDIEQHFSVSLDDMKSLTPLEEQRALEDAYERF